MKLIHYSIIHLGNFALPEKEICNLKRTLRLKFWSGSINKFVAFLITMSSLILCSQSILYSAKLTLDTKFQAHPVKDERYGQQSVRSVLFLSENVLFSSGAKGGLKKWKIDSPNRKELLQERRYEGDQISELDLEPTRKLLGGFVETQNLTNERAILWKTDGLETQKQFSDLGGRAFAFHPEEPLVAVSIVEGSFWDIPQMFLSAIYTWFAPDMYGVRLMDYESGEIVREGFNHKNNVVVIEISASGDYLASGGVTNRLTLWSKELKSWHANLYHDARFNSQIYDVAFSKEEKYLISSGPDGVRIWDVSTGYQENKFTPEVPSDKISVRQLMNIHLIPETELLVATTNKGEVQIYNFLKSKLIFSEKILTVKEKEHRSVGYIKALDVSPNGEKLAVGTARGDIFVYSISKNISDVPPSQ